MTTKDRKGESVRTVMTDDRSLGGVCLLSFYGSCFSRTVCTLTLTFSDKGSRMKRTRDQLDRRPEVLQMLRLMFAFALYSMLAPPHNPFIVGWRRMLLAQRGWLLRYKDVLTNPQLTMRDYIRRAFPAVPNMLGIVGLLNWLGRARYFLRARRWALDENRAILRAMSENTPPTGLGG